MDQQVISSLATNGIFALLFGYLGMRHMKMADEDRQYIRSQQTTQAARDERIMVLLDRVTQRLDK
jgi:hypothetical protein